MKRNLRPFNEIKTCFLSGLFACAVLSSSALMPALAQDPEPIEVKVEMSIVTGLSDGELVTDADARLSAIGSTVLDSGLELGAAASLRADSDMPGQRYTGGRYSSILGGGQRGFGADDSDIFLDGAYLFARGGFGTIHVGRDEGVASRLAVTSPNIFTAIGVNDWRTDLSGLNDVNTVNDFSGQATKISYMPPVGFLGGVIGQLQLGMSYAPEIGNCQGGDCIPVTGLAIADNGALMSLEQSWKDVVETAVYYQKGIAVGDAPLTLGLSASFVSAENDSVSISPSLNALQPLFGDYNAYTFGVNLAYGGVTLGGSFKSTNAGLAEDRDEDYLAFDAGVTFETGEWNFMAGYGAANADRDASLLLLPNSALPILGTGVDRQTQTAQAGISYAFDHGVTLGAAAQFVNSEKPDALGGPEEAASIVFESSIKF